MSTEREIFDKEELIDLLGKSSKKLSKALYDNFINIIYYWLKFYKINSAFMKLFITSFWVFQILKS